MEIYTIVSNLGSRDWHADDADHAVEQHEDAFPDEVVLLVGKRVDA